MLSINIKNYFLKHYFKLFTGLTRNLSVSSSRKAPSMSELPVPSGSWEDLYSQRQKSHNLTLIAGILVLSGSLAVVRFTILLYCIIMYYINYLFIYRHCSYSC